MATQSSPSGRMADTPLLIPQRPTRVEELLDRLDRTLSRNASHKRRRHSSKQILWALQTEASNADAGRSQQ